MLYNTLKNTTNDVFRGIKMYCFNCGNELLDTQMYCPSCGSKNVSTGITNVSVSKNTMQNMDDIELNRDVMKNYLFNLRTLEFAKNKLITNKRNLENRVYYLARNVNISKPDPKDGVGFLVFLAIAFVVFLILSVCAAKADDGNGNGLIGSILGSILDFFAPLIYLLTAIAGVVTLVFLILFLDEVSSDKRKYEEAVKQNNIRMDRETKEKAQLQKVLVSVNKDLKATEKLLDEAYSINIIPNKYRSIGAIYFIHQNYTTSLMSFRDALFHCDLDEISQKLNTVIEQQSEIIMQLAYSNALNEKIVQQNNQLLDSAIRQEENQQRIEQYQRMNTVYNKTTAQIQSYYFYKNGL